MTEPSSPALIAIWRAGDVFNLASTLVSDYSAFARSCTNIKADDLKQSIDEVYRAGRFWPEPLMMPLIPGIRREAHPVILCQLEATARARIGHDLGARHTAGVPCPVSSLKGLGRPAADITERVGQLREYPHSDQVEADERLETGYGANPAGCLEREWAMQAAKPSADTEFAKANVEGREQGEPGRPTESC